MKKIILFTVLLGGFLWTTMKAQDYRLDIGTPSMSMEENQNIPGSDYRHFELKPSETCQVCIDACLNDPNCLAYTYVKPGIQGANAVCWLKTAVVSPISDKNCISGVKIFLKGNPLKEVTLAPGLGQDLIWSPQTGPAIKGGINLPGKDYKSFIIPAEQDQLPYVCQKACLDDPKCVSWTFVEPGMQDNRAVCWLKSEVPIPQKQDSCISGIRLMPTIKNQISKQSMDVAKVQEFKDALTQFDDDWKAIVMSSIGSLNNQYLENRTQEIISTKLLLSKSVMQLKRPGALPEPLPYPAYSMSMKGGRVMASYRGKQIIDMNLTSLSVPSALPEPIPNPGLSMDFHNGTITAKLNDKTINTVNVTASPSFRLPNLTGIHSITTDLVQLNEIKKSAAYNGSLGLSTILDCHYIIIYGKNLGMVSDTCGIRIEYDIQTIEDFTSKPPIHYAFDLIPYGGSWKNSWLDDFIVALVPPLPGPNDINKPTSTKFSNEMISIWMGGKESYILKKEIDIKNTDPGIAVVLYSPFDTPLYDKATFWIYGTGFGATKEGNEIYIESATKRYSVTTVNSCSKNVIEAQAPDFMLDIPSYAKLVVHNLESGRKTEWPIQIGPLMTYVWITGAKFATLGHPDEADEGHPEATTISDKFQNVYAVSHYPGCGVNGNDTDDEYFKSSPSSPNKGMPPYFRYNDLFFYPMDQYVHKSLEDFILEDLQGVLYAGLNPTGWVAEKIINLFAYLFNPGVGKYDLYIKKLPTIQDPSTVIHFNNTCWYNSDYYNLPNKYLIAFQLYGPEKYIDQLEYDYDSVIESIIK